jgi:flavodoxin
MNTLVVYDSQYGNTARIAQTIADTLRASGQAQAVRVDPTHPVSFQRVDLLIVGCPTQGFRPTPAMQSFLGTVPFQSLGGLAVACFDTRFRGALWKSSAAPRMARQLRTMGVEPLVPPESFFVKAMKKEGHRFLVAPYGVVAVLRQSPWPNCQPSRRLLCSNSICCMSLRLDPTSMPRETRPLRLLSVRHRVTRSFRLRRWRACRRNVA